MGRNVEKDLKEAGWEDVNWIPLADDRSRLLVVVNAVMNCQVQYNAVFLMSG